MALNAKQRLFVKNYLIHKNATRAAKSAGYSPKTSHVIGAENLTKPEIRKAIDAGIARQTDKADASAERVIEHLADIAFQKLNRLDKKRWSANKIRALELLGKRHKLFTDMHEHSGKDGNAIQVLLTMPPNGSEKPNEPDEGASS